MNAGHVGHGGVYRAHRIRAGHAGQGRRMCSFIDEGVGAVGRLLTGGRLLPCLALSALCRGRPVAGDAQPLENLAKLFRINAARVGDILLAPFVYVYVAGCGKEISGKDLSLILVTRKKEYYSFRHCTCLHI